MLASVCWSIPKSMRTERRRHDDRFSSPQQGKLVVIPRDAAEAGCLQLKATAPLVFRRTNILTDHTSNIRGAYHPSRPIDPSCTRSKYCTKYFISAQIFQIETLFHIIPRSPYRLSAHSITSYGCYEYCSLFEHCGSLKGNYE